ncbi:MAG: hypothetical protein WEC73_02990, partial [Chthoniobacterales bacterium]
MKTTYRFPTMVSAVRLIVVVFVALFLRLPVSAQPTTNAWDGGGTNTSWGTAANWVGDVVPTFNTDAVLVFDTN